MVNTFFCKICLLIIGNQNYPEFSHTNSNHEKMMLSLSGLDISCLISSHICYLIELQGSEISVVFNKVGSCFGTSFFNFSFYIMKCFLLGFTQQQIEILFS